MPTNGTYSAQLAGYVDGSIVSGSAFNTVKVKSAKVVSVIIFGETPRRHLRWLTRLVPDRKQANQSSVHLSLSDCRSYSYDVVLQLRKTWIRISHYLKSTILPAIVVAPILLLFRLGARAKVLRLTILSIV